MEIIRLAGYVYEEKLAIANQHLGGCFVVFYPTCVFDRAGVEVAWIGRHHQLAL